ncbi:histidinol-phosphate aminotransferase [Ferroglobus placidus DSM 10642]|uniref:Histidinol-phosphate aminotransferase n=1 Tax=Ferroglobus placidus (strain DSM 10642 / AEDII12DO) TaxID=589924 RepID=D3RZA2_FERPA|nr:histidinol-phosphate transaminase [Ferroglobus placidus]ADC65815.1 histidinol-phosphate aminotransferase [Ferroglobus placidus DSM 10642]
MRYVVGLINKYDAGKFPKDLKEMGIGRVIQLASNENPYPPPEEVIEAVKKEVLWINRYPHPEYRDLKEKIAEYCKVDYGMISIGSGAMDILKVIADVLLEPFDKVVVPMPSYSYYTFVSMLRDAGVEEVIFEGYRVNVESLSGKLVFLCSPNNPTGNTVDEKTVRDACENFEYVVLDEAYAEFAGKSFVKLLDEYENLIILRTFSKYFGLAGMRVGYSLSNESIAEAIEKIRSPFAISPLAAKAAEVALDNLDYYERVRRKIVTLREKMRRELENYYYVYPSEANFLLFKHDRENLVDEFLKRGIILRDVTGLRGLEGNHVRVTVGREGEVEIFLEVLREINED